MANSLVIDTLYNRVAANYNNLRKIISKLHKLSSSVGFIKKSLFNNITPTFAKVKGQFINKNTKLNAEKEVMKNHLSKHYNDIRDLKLQYNFIEKEIQSGIGVIFTKVLIRYIESSLRKERLESFKVKNNKIFNLIKRKPLLTYPEYKVPIINLSDHQLTKEEYQQLKFGLNHSFINKDKNLKKDIAIHMESLAFKASKEVDNIDLENFHEFLRGYTDIFSKNVSNSEDFTYKNLKSLIHDQNIVILKGDKDSSVTIMNKGDYIEKLENMLEDGISKGTYKRTDDTTLQDLKRYQDFLYRNFYNYEHYKKMYPQSNQPAKLYGTAKTHKFNDTNDITINQLKFRPIIDQTGTYTYNAAQVISQYLKPLCKNEFTIEDTQSFSKTIRDLPPLEDEEEDVSYDVESLFTNIPIEETVNYILDQIYVRKVIAPICTKLIFKRLLMKLATEVIFTFNNTFYRQTNGCTMGGPLSVILSDIYIIKMENDIVRPLQPKFYRRYVDDIYNRRRKDEFDKVFYELNNYHQNIKLTIELNPSKFLDTELICKEGNYSTKVHRKETKVPTHWSSSIPKRYKRNIITTDLHRAENIASNIEEEIKTIRKKFIKADYPVPFINSVINQYKDKIKEKEIDDDYIIPPFLFKEEKPFILLKLPFCEQNEQKSKDFIKKFHKFTKDSWKTISWKTRKIRSLFNIKD